eukprot:TRINITY_DN67491_c9_g3_i1.p1 TRINITY_DN67491_c9_g3~~TRINITY_DN67491_c9_g3_i1.p1  ORF type:complete len:569 (-),score=49.77 TRINITY_DN67491_c9_g3_i1:173-1639(-)
MREYCRDRVAEQQDTWRLTKQLPKNVIKLILQYVADISTLHTLTWVCRRWKELASHDQFWEPLLRRRRRAEQMRTQSYGMIPAINVKRQFKEWYLNWLRDTWSEKGQKRQEEFYRKEVRDNVFLHHTSHITAVRVYWKDGQSYILTGDEKGMVQMRDPGKRKEDQVLHILSEHEGAINAIEVSKNFIFTCADDSLCHVWTHDSLAFPKYTLAAHADAVTCVGFVKEKDTKIVTGSMDRNLFIWDLGKIQSVPTKGNYNSIKPATLKLAGHSMKITVIQCTDKKIFSASTDAQVRMWDWRGKLLGTLTGHSGPIHCMQLVNLHDRTGNSVECVVSACGGGMIRCWHSETGKILWGKVVASTPINCMDISNDIVVTGSSDGMLNVYNTATESNMALLKGHDSVVRNIALDASRQRLVSSSDDKTCCVWDLAEAAKLNEDSGIRSYCFPLYQLKGPKAAIILMTLQKNAEGKWQRVVAVGNDKTVHYWNMR